MKVSPNLTSGAHRKRLSTVLCLFLMLAAGAVSEATPPSPFKRERTTPAITCERILMEGADGSNQAGELIVNYSGRDEDVRDFLRAGMREIFASDGVAARLGLPLPPHELNFLPSHELTALATLGHHAIGHWQEGATLIQRLFRTLGVYEFVWEGCPHCRSYYADVTDPYEQLSIMMHVVGHNVFSATANSQRVRHADPIRASWELARLLEVEEAKDYDQVHRFIQRLSTLMHLQDFHAGTFEAPPTLAPDGRQPASERYDHATLGERDPTPSPRDPALHPARSTASVLQFFTANPPQDLSPGYRDILNRYEEMSRVSPAVVHSKIMNEGFATYLMLMLAKYASSTNDEARIKYSRLINSVAGVRGGFSNPYTLGLQAWMAMYRKISRRTESRGKTEQELDRIFVQEALQMISWMDDRSFLAAALDEDFVRQFNLKLIRRLPRAEWDPSLPRTKPEDQIQVQVETTDWRRVVRHMAHKHGRKDIYYPLIHVVRDRAFGRGVHYLEQRHSFDKFPLDLKSVAESLSVMARLHRRPVGLKGLANLGPYFRPSDRELLRQAGVNWMTLEEVLKDPHMRHWLQQMREQWARNAVVVGEFYMEVDEAGGVRFEIQSVQTSATTQDKTQAEAAAHAEFTSLIQALIEDDDLSVNPRVSQSDRERWGPLVNQAVDFNLRPPSRMVSQTPTMGRAYQAYATMLRRRMQAKMEALRSGKIQGRRTSRGVAVSVLPRTPEIQYDRQLMQTILSSKTRPVEHGASHRLSLSSGMPQIWTTSPRGAPVLDVELTSQVQRAFLEAQQNGEAEHLTRIWSGLIAAQERVESWPTPDLFALYAAVGDGNEEGSIVTPGPGSDGDRGWSPDPDGQGQGGKPGPGEPGEDELDPTEIELPLGLWGQILASELELPRLKPKAGRSPMTDTARMGRERRASGDVRWADSSREAIRRGLGILHGQSEGDDEEPVDPFEALELGFASTPRAQLVKVGRDRVQVPDMKAVVEIIIDGSGSMLGWPIERVKDFVFNFHALLTAKYKNIEFVFIMFDGTAVVAKTLEEAMRMQKGGGTNYAAGFNKGEEELRRRFPPSQYDRYVLIAGDSGDFAPLEQAMAAFNRLRNQAEYVAYLHVPVMGDSPLNQQIQSMSGDGEYLGYAEITQEESSSFVALRRLFGKNRQGEAR